MVKELVAKRIICIAGVLSILYLAWDKLLHHSPPLLDVRASRFIITDDRDPNVPEARTLVHNAQGEIVFRLQRGR